MPFGIQSRSTALRKKVADAFDRTEPPISVRTAHQFLLAEGVQYSKEPSETVADKELDGNDLQTIYDNLPKKLTGDIVHQIVDQHVSET